MLRRIATLAGLAGAVALTACSDDPLSVTNRNAPTVNALLSTPVGAQTLASRFFQFAFQGQYGSSDAIWPQTMVMAGESEGAVANFGMLTRGGFPRSAIDNQVNNGVQLGNVRDFSFLTRAARQSGFVIGALNQFASSYDPGTAARNRAFAYFTLGYSLGHMALIYDSVVVSTAQTPADSLPGFTASPQAMTVALAMLDTAQQIGSDPAATVPVPQQWMATPSDVPMATFVRLVRSMKARFRANMPRTPGEVAAVDWAAVEADARNGIQANFIINLNQGTNWTALFLNQSQVSATWHQMPYWVIGMADTTGAYATWVGQAVGGKTPFLIRTPDRRFPRGGTRDEQIAFANPDVPPSDTVLYFRNRRAGQDVAGGPSGGSFYDNFRFRAYFANNLQAPWPLMTRAENDMLQAEALMRVNRVADAIPLINRYRTRAELPAIPATTALTSLVPGGNACVPRTPTRSGGTVTLQCANVFEAMKYEKRLETAFTGYAAWFLDSRRWGDLFQGTPLEWPVPFNETEARNIRPPYQNQRVATGIDTYGWLP
jgi:hypothetical protein